MHYGMPAPDQIDAELLAERVAAAWRDFVAAVDAKYPASAWPQERLLDLRDELDAEAMRSEQYGACAEREGWAPGASFYYEAFAAKNAQTVVLGAVLAARGYAPAERDADELAHSMARVICGAGPERRVVTTRGPDGRNLDTVLLDEASDRAYRAVWNEAALYAAPHRLAELLPAAWTHGPAGIPPAIAEDLARDRQKVPEREPDRGPDWGL